MSHFLVYGDSVPAGSGVSPQCNFVSLLQTHLSRAHPFLQGYNFSVPGLDSPGLYQLLSHGTGLDLVPSASFLVVYIGGNDLLAGLPHFLTRGARSIPAMVQHSRQALQRSLCLLRRLSGAPLLCGTLYNPYPQIPLAVAAVTLYNERAILPAARAAHARVVPIYEAFLGQETLLLQKSFVNGRAGGSVDPASVHPNGRGHSVIARLFLQYL